MKGLRMDHVDHDVSAVQASLLGDAAWRKSSYCVEAATLTSAIALRDSRFPDGPALVFASAAWDAFLRGVKGRCSG